MQDVTEKMITRFLGNEDIVKVLAHNGENCLLNSKYVNPLSMRDVILPFKYTLETQTEKKTYITMEMASGGVDDSLKYIPWSIAFYIFTHQDIMMIRDHNDRLVCRTHFLASLIATELHRSNPFEDDEFRFLGRMKLAGVNPIEVTHYHKGVCVVYDILDLAVKQR